MNDHFGSSGLTLAKLRVEPRVDTYPKILPGIGGRTGFPLTGNLKFPAPGMPGTCPGIPPRRIPPNFCIIAAIFFCTSSEICAAFSFVGFPSAVPVVGFAE